jgi:hypothetical protein
MPRDFSHFKKPELENSDYAKELRARIADINELLAEAPGRNVVVHMTVAQLLKSPMDLTPHIHAIIAERI